MKLCQMAPRNKYHRMSRSLRAYSDRSNDEAGVFRRRLRETISNAIEVNNGLLVSLSRDNMTTSKKMSAVWSHGIAKYLTIDEGSQDVQRFNKPVSGSGQRLHESERRLHRRSGECLGKQKVVYRRDGRGRGWGWDKEMVGL